MYKIGTLAKITGFSSTLLRAWEKRYGLLRPLRGPGGQRLYGEEDLRLLELIRKEFARGRRIGEVVAMGPDRLRAAAMEKPVAAGGLPFVGDDSETDDLASAQFMQALLAAAAALDGVSLRGGLDALFSTLSADKAVYRVLVPALHQLGEEWGAGRISVAAEHLAANLIEARLLGLIETLRRAAGRTLGPETALCCCFPEEEHRIGMAIVAYCLVRQGWDAIFLGASLPFADLDDALQRLRPATVWLSVTSVDLYQRYCNDLFALADRHRQVRFVVGGQAITEDAAAARQPNCLLSRQPCLLPGGLQELLARLWLAPGKGDGADGINVKDCRALDSRYRDD